MSVVNSPVKVLTGRSFEPADLIFIRGWSEAHGLRMIVRLDHGSDTEDYEEVLSFHTGASCLCRWIMWRNMEAVFVQPLVGRRQAFGSVAAAIEVLAPRQPVILTDINPTSARTTRLND